MSCACGMDARVIMVGGLGGPLDGVMPDLLPSRSILGLLAICYGVRVGEHLFNV